MSLLSLLAASLSGPSSHPFCSSPPALSADSISLHPREERIAEHACPGPCHTSPPPTHRALNLLQQGHSTSVFGLPHFCDLQQEHTPNSFIGRWLLSIRAMCPNNFSVRLARIDETHLCLANLHSVVLCCLSQRDTSIIIVKNRLMKLCRWCTWGSSNTAHSRP